MKKNLKFLMILFCAVAFTACTKGPDKVAVQFFENIKENKIDTASKLISSSRFSESQIREALAKLTSEYGNVKKIEILNTEIKGEMAKVELKLIGDKEQKEPVNLIQKDGKWFISF